MNEQKHLNSHVISTRLSPLPSATAAATDPNCLTRDYSFESVCLTFPGVMIRDQTTVGMEREREREENNADATIIHELYSRLIFMNENCLIALALPTIHSV